MKYKNIYKVYIYMHQSPCWTGKISLGTIAEGLEY